MNTLKMTRLKSLPIPNTNIKTGYSSSLSCFLQLFPSHFEVFDGRVFRFFSFSSELLLESSDEEDESDEEESSEDEEDLEELDDFLCFRFDLK